MCVGREGTTAKTCPVDAAYESPWLWVVLTLVLWVLFMLLVCFFKVCTHRRRRHRFLNECVSPLCRKFGVMVSWDDLESQTQGRVAVYVTGASADLPPSYEMAVTCYVNAVFTAPDLSPPPSYDEYMASLTSRNDAPAAISLSNESTNL